MNLLGNGYTGNEKRWTKIPQSESARDVISWKVRPPTPLEKVVCLREQNIQVCTFDKARGWRMWFARSLNFACKSILDLGLIHEAKISLSHEICTLGTWCRRKDTAKNGTGLRSACSPAYYFIKNAMLENLQVLALRCYSHPCGLKGNSKSGYSWCPRCLASEGTESRKPQSFDIQ